jgi:hypothetical protein
MSTPTDSSGSGRRGKRGTPAARAGSNQAASAWPPDDVAGQPISAIRAAKCSPGSRCTATPVERALAGYSAARTGSAGVVEQADGRPGRLMRSYRQPDGTVVLVPLS